MKDISEKHLNGKELYMQSNTTYTENFYKKHQRGSRRSAREIVPLVIELIRPQSVIDLGCGSGIWLSVFREHGIQDYFGIDGNWIDKKMLEIPEEQFLSFDLKNPFQMDRQFDLVMSMEVVEHLPSQCAEIFVESLVRLAPVILFSAAIPLQGGTDHVNEQWPEYWVRYFDEKGYVVIDCIRKKIWQNENVEWWYAQNLLIFVRRDHLESCPLLKREFKNTDLSQLSIVHPRKYLHEKWLQRVLLARQDILELIPLGDTLILSDQDQFGSEFLPGRYTIPFLEKDKCYFGPPSDDMTAIKELKRLRNSGANFFVFAWPAFWWLDYYTELKRYLTSKFKCILKNDRLVIFDLRR